MALIDKKVSEIYAGRDISSLSDTPSKDGMSASELKARFDQLNKEVIPNYNDLIDELITDFADIETGKINSDGSESNIDEIQFDVAQTDTPSGEGAIVYNADEKTFQGGLGNGVVGDFFRETFYPKCKNNDTVTINNGDFVMYDGTSGASGVVLVKKASTNLVLAGMGMGIATETISTGQSGNITWFGLVRGINTTGSTVGETWVDGDILYNSGTVVGGLSKTKPVAPKPAIMVAVVHRSHATTGQLLVRPMYFPNLTQLSDVYTSSIANGDAYIWNSSNARFENVPVYSKAQVDSALSANSTADRARANHTGTQSADTLTDGTINKAYLATERTKLAGIETGAEVNNISDVNATDLTDGGETTLHKHDGMYYTESELNTGQLDSRYYTKTQVDSIVSSMYEYKGSVATYEDLPTSEQSIGDTWNVEYNGHNFAWNGTDWDDLGGVSVGVTHFEELLDVPEYTGNAGKVPKVNGAESGLEYFEVVEKTSSTGSAKMPYGTTAERPSVVQVGHMRFNTDLNAVETYNGSQWLTSAGQMLGNAVTKAISYNAQTIAENITIPATYNASSVGTITIEDGYTVTLEDGAVWVII